MTRKMKVNVMRNSKIKQNKKNYLIGSIIKIYPRTKASTGYTILSTAG